MSHRTSTTAILTPALNDNMAGLDYWPRSKIPSPNLLAAESFFVLDVFV